MSILAAPLHSFDSTHLL